MTFSKTPATFRQYLARPIVDGVELPQKVLAATTVSPERFIHHNLAAITTHPAEYAVYIYFERTDTEKFLKNVTVTPLESQMKA